MGTRREHWVSKTALSKQAGALRMSLLVSLGLSPLACGGTVISTDGDVHGGAGAGAGTVSPEYGGGPTSAGASSGGASVGGNSFAGSFNDTGGATVGGATGRVPVCTNPIVDPLSQLVSCSNGLRHRPMAVLCPTPITELGLAGATGEGGDAGQAPAEAGAGGAGGAGCTSDAECAGLRLGYCDFYGGGFVESKCRSGCTQDSDCGGAAICVCDGSATGGKCLSAGCTVDADCGPNSLCSLAPGICSDGSYQCLRQDDECWTDADCGLHGQCTAGSNDAGRVCNNSVCGRPFLVAALPRFASITTRADWLEASLAPNLSGLSPVQRAELAAHWARLGQMEHASIAAFARFNLQLLSLGAPGELIEACNRALADETAHTRLCFALASHYGGTPVGPGRLEVRDCFEDNRLPAIMKLTLREGCLGETVAALEAFEAAHQASDPAVKSALSRIARDEQTHAELAFHFLQWALDQASSVERDEFARDIEAELADFESAALARTADEHNLSAHGVLSARSLRTVQLEAVRSIVRPVLARISRSFAAAAQRALLRHCAAPGVVATTE